MVSLMANGGGGQYDLVSASGDADLRLIYGGDVRPVNISLIPSWKDFQSVPAESALQHDRRQALRRLVRVRPRTSCCTRPRPSRPRRPPGPCSTTKKYAGQITVPEQPDSDCRRRAVPLERPIRSLGITDRVRVDPAAVQRCTVSLLLKQEHPLVKKPTGISRPRRSPCSRAATTVVGAAWPYQTNTAAVGRSEGGGRRDDPQ
jgi:putative spermidine/putrescine transport system substrate-binding protein